MTSYVHGGRGEVGVLTLELAVQGQAVLVLVVRQQRCERIHLTEREAGPHRAALPAETQRGAVSDTGHQMSGH